MTAWYRSIWATRIAQIPGLRAVGAGLCLVAMVVVVSAGVILRYVFGAPLLGVNEIVQLVAVALVMMALPYATQSGAHVRVDLFDKPLGKWGRFFGDLLSRVLAIVTLYVLCGQAWKKAAEAIEFGDTTNMLAIPLWPVYGAICAGMALCAVVFAIQIVALIFGWKTGND